LKKFSKVILLPDDDQAGERYSQAIQDSLRAEGIAYSVVSFNGTGAKGVTEHMVSHSRENLVRLIDLALIHMPDGTLLPASKGYNFISKEVITV
jgi:hypothetical protein